MQGTKRSRDSRPKDSSQNAPPSSSSSPYVPMFEQFRAELDEHYDRREHIVKASRDITALSKKIIFALQRTPNVPSTPLPESVLSATRPLSRQINYLLASVAAELISPPKSAENQQTDTPNRYRYLFQYSPGIQEFTESLAFAHYLQHQRLISPEEVAAALRVTVASKPSTSGRVGEPNDTEGQASTPPPVVFQIPLTDADYVGGISDLVGEMMRFGITGVATSGRLPGEAASPSDSNDDSDGSEPRNGSRAPPSPTRSILTDLRALRSSFESLVIPARAPSGGSTLAGTIASKIGTTRQSVEKVEYAAYGLVVRGSERPKGWVPDLEGMGGGAGAGMDSGGSEPVDVY